MCIFIEKWDCNFAGQEITLDICKTCIDAKRLYHETKHDKALQERKKRMEKEVKEQKPEPGIVPEREKPKERPDPEERPTRETEAEPTAESVEIEEKSPLETIEEEIYSGKVEEKGFIESLAEESSKTTAEDDSSIERLEPASIIEMENLEGSVEDIRTDPTRPTDTWLTKTDEGEESLLKAEFPNPPDKLQIGEDKQKFLVRVRRTEDEFFFPPYPEVNIKICEDGDVVTETGRKEVEDVHGEVVSLNWNAGELLDLYGTDVEIVVEGFGIGDEGTTQNRIEIGAVEWRANLVESTAKAERSDEQTLEEKLSSPLKEKTEDETIETIRSDLNPMG